MLNARWDPLYDLYATSENGKPSTSVFLHYRVNVSQNTGEDWTGARLTLSTSATDILNAGIPKPDNLIIKPPTPPPARVLMPSASLVRAPPRFRYRSAFGEPSLPSADKLEEEVDEDDDMGIFSFDGDDGLQPMLHAVPLPQLAQSAATISKSPMIVSYTVEALTTIPSDDLSYKVLVATVPLEAIITHIATPRKSPIAYLQVRKAIILGVLG